MTRRKFLSVRGILTAAVLVVAIAVSQSAVQAQKLTASANPPSGVAGLNDSYLTGSGFPAGTISGGTVSFSATCGGSVIASGPVIQVAVEGVLRRFEFLIPASLKTGTYEVSVAGTAGATPFNTAGSSCSSISVTATSTTLAACVPTSSLAVTAGTNVNAYVPFGAWDGEGTTGIEEVPLEGSGTAAHFTTTGEVNSCASNSVTSEVVCTENTSNVDLINGSTLTTVTSGSNNEAGFSGGDCNNCGVGINPANNTAVIAMGYLPSSSNSALQVLNLSNNTFNTPVALAHEVSEDISIDSTNNFILSPDEQGYYELVKIGSGNALTEYSNFVGTDGGELDSAAEDCTTQIAYASDEFTNLMYITDVSQATFTSGTPGTWSAPGQFVDLSVGEASTFDSFSAGTCGISTAPGSGHYGVITGEFGGSSFAAFQGPATSGSGTPALQDYAYVSSLTLPGGGAFSAGFDPHTVTAYTSPNSNKAFAVMVDWSSGVPDYLAVVDLAGVLAAPRVAGTHTVDLTKGTPWLTYVAIP
jgi:hypothetical protein